MARPDAVTPVRGGRAGDASRATGRLIAGNALTQLLVRGGAVVLGVVTVGLLARSLGPSDFGAWTTALAYVGLFTFLTDFGFVQVAVQRMAAEPEREAEWLGALTTARAGASVLALAVCLLGLPLLGAENDIRPLTLVLSLTILAAVPTALLAVFQSRLQAGLTMSLLALQSVLWLGFVLLLWMSSAELLTFAWAFVAVAMVTGVAQVLATRRFAVIALRRGLALWRPLTRVALPLGIAGILVTVYYRIDQVMLFNLRGPREAGIYGAAYRILDPLHFFPAAVMSSLLPVLAAAKGRDPMRIARLVQAGADYLTVVSLPVLGTSIALSSPLIRLVFGPGFEGAAALLPILMLAFVFVCFGYLAGYLIPVANLQWRYAGYAALGAVVNVGLNAAFIPAYGAHAAAWSTVATEFGVMTLCLVAVLRALRLRPSPSRILRTAAAAALMTLVMLGVNGLAGLALALLAGGGTYVLALLALRVVVFSELRELIGDRGAG